MDSLIVQRGVTVKSSGSKEKGVDLKNIILFGSTEVFKAQEEGNAEMTDADVDALLEAAEKDQEERQACLSKIEEEFNLKDLRMDGGLKLSDHRDETAADDVMKQLNDQALDTIQNDMLNELDSERLERRLRKSIATQNEISKIESTKKQKKFTGWKGYTKGDLPHHLYSAETIKELDALDNKLEPLEMTPNPDEDTRTQIEDLKDQQMNLLDTGFYNWNKTEFEILKKALTLWKPNEYDKLEEAIQTKELSEIKEYMEALHENEDAAPGFKRALESGKSLHSLISKRLRERKIMKELINPIFKDIDESDNIISHEEAIALVTENIFNKDFSKSRAKELEKFIYSKDGNPALEYLYDVETEEEIIESLKRFDSILLYGLYYAILHIEEYEARPVSTVMDIPSFLTPTPSPGRQWVRGVGWVKNGQIGFNARFAKFDSGEAPRGNAPIGFINRDKICSIDTSILERTLQFIDIIKQDTITSYPCIRNVSIDMEDECSLDLKSWLISFVKLSLNLNPKAKVAVKGKGKTRNSKVNQNKKQTSGKSNTTLSPPVKKSKSIPKTG